MIFNETSKNADPICSYLIKKSNLESIPPYLLYPVQQQNFKDELILELYIMYFRSLKCLWIKLFHKDHKVFMSCLKIYQLIVS